MKKIKTLFKRDYEGTRLVYDEVVEGCEWVLAGEGIATLKIDGTSCLFRDGVLYKRYDRKPSKSAQKQHSKGQPWTPEECAPAPEGWEPAEASPDPESGSWPGWVPVGDGPDDQWHREAWDRIGGLAYWTYELVGPKVQGNPYNLKDHQLIPHGQMKFRDGDEPPRDFTGLRAWLASHDDEGIVWWRGPAVECEKVKLKRRDFGYPWPPVKS